MRHDIPTEPATKYLFIRCHQVSHVEQTGMPFLNYSPELVQDLRLA